LPPQEFRRQPVPPAEQPLVLHAEIGNAMRAATLEARLEELSVLHSFSRPRVSNDNPYSESLFRTVKYRPDYSGRPFANKAETCESCPQCRSPAQSGALYSGSGLPIDKLGMRKPTPHPFITISNDLS
jgi:transposase InsO family protein